MKIIFKPFLLSVVLLFSLVSSAYGEGVTPSVYSNSVNERVVEYVVQPAISATSEQDGQEITLTRGPDGNFSTTVNLTPVDAAARAGGYVTGLTMSLGRYPGTQNYQLDYTVSSVGEPMVYLRANFKVQNTSAISPSLWVNEDVKKSIPDLYYYGNIVDKFVIPDYVDTVKATASNIFITLLESGPISVPKLDIVFDVNN